MVGPGSETKEQEPLAGLSPAGGRLISYRQGVGSVLKWALRAMAGKEATSPSRHLSGMFAKRVGDLRDHPLQLGDIGLKLVHPFRQSRLAGLALRSGVFKRNADVATASALYDGVMRLLLLLDKEVELIGQSDVAAQLKSCTAL